MPIVCWLAQGLVSLESPSQNVRHGVLLAILDTHPKSHPGILLLRTNAVYTRSKRVMIPLTTAYTVRPQFSFAGMFETYRNPDRCSGRDSDHLALSPHNPRWVIPRFWRRLSDGIR